jgi:raffinose/stachyose/melibiose transport system permease protein
MFITIIPFVSLFVTALHKPGTYPSGLEWPDDPHWENFANAFDAANMGALLKSSFLIELGVVPLAVLIATLAGFALGHLKVPFHRALFVIFVLGLTLPFEGIIVPLYYQMRGYGLLNTQWAIILPLLGLFMPFAVMWMRAHFVNMPQDLSEAARVDGASTWQLFWRVHVPLSAPAISSLAILLFLWTWNQFLLAIVLVDDPSKRTMAGALGAFQGQWGTDIPMLCAGSLLILTPTLLVFLAFQRQFVAALLQGAVKG